MSSHTAEIPVKARSHRILWMQSQTKYRSLCPMGAPDITRASPGGHSRRWVVGNPDTGNELKTSCVFAVFEPHVQRGYVELIYAGGKQ